MTYRYRNVATAACALVLAACQPEPANTSRGHDPDPGTENVAATDAACTTHYAGSGEIASTGELVQLDVTFRLHATRSGAREANDTSISLDAESVVEGKSSQLACLWEREDGSPGLFDLKPLGDAAETRFPRKAEGHARLAGARNLHANGMTVREEVDVSGALETLIVKSIGVRDRHDSDTCVILGFDVPMRGRSVRTITAPGINREEAINPSGLVSDSYSAMSPDSSGGGNHHFAAASFAICTGEEAERPTPTGDRPLGLSISSDGRVWQRSGTWSNHLSGPNEKRVVDFTMRVVPPTPELRAALNSARPPEA